MNSSIAKVLLAVVLAINALCWSRFYSWGFLNPWWDSEVSLPVLPLLAGFTLFSWLVIDQGQFQDRARRELEGILKRRAPGVLITVGALTIATLTLTSLWTPPKWADLIDNGLLSGYDDEFARAISIEKTLATKNAEFSLLLKTAIELEGKNKEHANWVDPESIKRLNQLQKTLDTLQPATGYGRVLQGYSRALLNDMFLRLEYFQDDMGVVAREIQDSLHAVLRSKSIYRTRKLERVSRRMLANTLYKTGDVAGAIRLWEKLEESPNVYANLHVGYRDLGDFDQAMAASAAGFALIDKGIEEDSQSQEALVANTMATLMHMQRLDDAIQLYRSRYIARGRTSDSGLLQQYALLLVLTDNVGLAEKLLADGSLQEEEAGYVHLLLALENERSAEALAIARRLQDGDKTQMAPSRVWELTTADFEDSGYLGSAKLQGLLAWARENAI